MKKSILIGTVLLAVLLVTGCAKPTLPAFLGGGNISKDQARTVVTDFITNTLKAKATVKDVTEENGLYKVTITAGSQEVVTYLTKDGKKFFPQAMDVSNSSGDGEDKKQETGQDQAKPSSEATTKTDVPEVKLFVMSYCPYGTQIEKGILPVLETLGSKIKFNLEFVDYAMHGEKEIDENLRQYCLMQNQSDKFEDYLKCFLKAGDSANCLKSTGVDSTKLNSCVSATDSQFKVKASFNDKSTWSNGQFPPFDVNKTDNTTFGVQGSPTLVINGDRVSSSGRSPESILRAVCSGFKNPPSECQKQLSSTDPTPGFDNAETSGAGSGGSCGGN